MKRIIPSLLLLLMLFSSQALNSQERYERKSISYVNALWLATPSARKVQDKQMGVMLRSIKSSIEMERFDYNPLPDVLIHDFVTAANERDNLTVDQIASLMQAKLVPSINGILEGAMVTRAGELVSEEKKQGFMATKAKELGITLEEIEKVMNSAYIYIPILTKYERKQDKNDKDKYIYTMEGGIVWFHVSLAGDEPVVRLKVSKTTLSKGFGSDDFAWESAVRNFARNLQVATRDIAEFKLSSSISEVDNGDISFKLGRKEGIHRDDCFLVGEWIEYPCGDMDFERSGWVRIGRVADNRRDKTAKSSAWAVKRGSWAPGMTVVEHPRPPIDIALKPGAFYMKITDGKIPILGDYLEISDVYENNSPGLDLDAQYNLASITGLSQFFFLVGGNFVIPAKLKFKVDPTIFILSAATPPYVWGFHAGFMKKIYLGQFAVSIAGKGGLRYLTVEQKFRFGTTDYTYTVKNNTAGVQFDLSFEYAATPDINLGLFGGYRLFPVSEIWTQELKPTYSGALVSWDEDYPDINHTGPALGIYLHYTFPALPFDPISYVQAMLGR